MKTRHSMLSAPPSIIPRWFKIGFVSMGLIFCAIGSYWAWETLGFLRTAKSAVGRVDRFETRVSSREGTGTTRRTTTYAPVFTFRDEQGKDYTVTSNTGQNHAAYDRGQEVTVLYDPADPERARIHSFTQMWLLPVIFGSAGVAFLIVGLVMRPKRR